MRRRRAAIEKRSNYLGTGKRKADEGGMKGNEGQLRRRERQAKKRPVGKNEVVGKGGIKMDECEGKKEGKVGVVVLNVYYCLFP